MSTKCLICYGDYHKSSNDDSIIKIEENDTTDHSSSPKKSLLSKHLNVIFILRNIFQVPVSQLSNYLKNCPKVENWICICEKCQEIVKGYRNIYEDLLDISRKFKEAKLGIIKIFKRSYDDDKQEPGFIPDITDECRRFINNYEYRNLYSPCEDGDLQASNLVTSIHHDNWHWASDPNDIIRLGPDSCPDLNIHDYSQDHWSGIDDLLEPIPDEVQLQHKQLTSKRGRGRPPKKRGHHHHRANDEDEIVEPQSEEQSQPKKLASRGRGRPPKKRVHHHHNANGDDDIVEPELEEKQSQTQKLTPRGRGRPPRKQPKHLTESMEEWKPYKSIKKKWKPKTKTKRKPPSLKYPCPHAPECSLRFSNRTILDSHLKADHGLVKRRGVPKKYPPEFYDESETRKQRFRVRIPSKCESCNKWFKTQDCLRTHIKFSHENRFPYYCKICGVGRTTKSMLESHEARCSKTPEVSTTSTLPETESCPEEGCKWVVARITGLEIHFRDKHPDREPFSGCPHCELKFYTLMAYARHLKSEHNISKPFKCEHCGLEFKTPCAVENHKKKALRCKLLYKSETEVTVICDICGGRYSSQENLLKHVRSQHEDQFKFRCEICGKGFGKEEILNVHLFKKHQAGDGSNLKYRCRVEGCSRVFYTSSTLECHMALHEGRAPKFTCEECGKGFHGKCGLRQHKKLMHENKLNEKRFKCEVCEAGFGVMDYLTRHRRVVHKIFPEKRRQDL